MVEGDGYTEYGYRGLEELKRANEKITELKEQINELKKRLEKMVNENEST